jgi:hypothetical protein
MRAIIINEFSSLDRFVTENLSDSTPAAGQVLIQLRALGLNTLKREQTCGPFGIGQETSSLFTPPSPFEFVSVLFLGGRKIWASLIKRLDESFHVLWRPTVLF